MIQTKRLQLEKIDKKNISGLDQIQFSKEVMKYIVGRALTTEEAIQRYSFDLNHKYFGTYFVKTLEDDEPIGIAVIRDKGDEVEIGYLVMEFFTGQGFATEINKALIRFCRRYIGSKTVSAMVDARNKASVRVLEKSGMWKTKMLNENGNKICKYLF